MIWLSIAFFTVGFGLSLWLWINPLLRVRPAFRDFYAATDSFWMAVWGKISTIKTKLSAVLLMVASGLVELYDTLMPLIMGTDWSPLMARVPSWVWPLASFAIGAFFLWLRNVTAHTHEIQERAMAQGATPTEAKVIAGILPPIATADNKKDD